MVTDKKISKIWIYPFKSLPGIEIKESRILPSGLEFDRDWMLINNAGKFITAREFPSLFNFSIAIDKIKKDIIVTNPSGNNTIQFPAVPTEGVQLDAEIWGQAIKVVHPSEIVSDFFSEYMKQKVKAVYANQNSGRIINSNQNLAFRINLSDGFPFLILGEASIHQLSAKYHEAIDIRRFRPNMVFSGGSPFEEDYWKKASIGSSTFFCERKCARCVMVSYQPDTAIPDPEILKLLNVERREGNKIMVGMNLSLIDGDVIRVNDPVLSA